jgi:hypothetical protein
MSARPRVPKVFRAITMTFIRYGLQAQLYDRFRRGTIEPLLDNFLFCVIPPDTGSGFLSLAELVFGKLNFLVHVLKNISGRLVFHLLSLCPLKEVG